MGGPASSFLWCLAFEPIIQFLCDACGCDAPTYVDDQVTLLALGKLAGLAAAAHDNTQVTAATGYTALVEILAPLPVTITRRLDLGPDGVAMTGLPGDFPLPPDVPPPAVNVCI